MSCWDIFSSIDTVLGIEMVVLLGSCLSGRVCLENWTAVIDRCCRRGDLSIARFGRLHCDPGAHVPVLQRVAAFRVGQWAKRLLCTFNCSRFLNSASQRPHLG